MSKATEVPGRLDSPLSEVLGPNAPTPRAWAIFVDSGNARMWSTLQPHVQKLAYAEGLEVTPLYGPEALAAERKRCALLCETWMEAAERESGPEAAGWLHQMARHMRGLGA